MTLRTQWPFDSWKRCLKLLVVAGLAAALAGCAGAGVKTGQYVDDSAITTKVKADLAADKIVSALKVHVETVHGVVRLSGFVETDVQKRRAGEIARSVDGVRSVENALVIGK